MKWVELPDLGILRAIFGPLRELPLPCITRVLAHPKRLGNFRYPVAPLGDLRLHIAIELITEIGVPIVVPCPQMLERRRPQTQKLPKTLFPSNLDLDMGQLLEWTIFKQT